MNTVKYDLKTNKYYLSVSWQKTQIPPESLAISHIMASMILLRHVEKFVRELLDQKLPQQMYFHNLLHTLDVVNAVKEISSRSALSKDEKIIVQTAAWFHDSGYCFVYYGHEDTSMAIAASFLMQKKVDEAIIDKVLACINATKMPHQPTDILQEIICDADMFHLAKEEYPAYAKRLRLEWEHKLEKRYTDDEWLQSNLSLFNTHRYFTTYGKTILEKSKNNNLKLLEQLA